MTDVKDRFAVRRIDHRDALPFIMRIHYARRRPCIQYAFGLFDGDYPYPVGVVTYGQPASAPLCKGIAGEENRAHVLELNRLVLYPEYNGGGVLASYLVAHSLRMLPHGTFVVSYADWEGWHHVGYVYQATNWLYTGMTKSRTDKYSEGHARHYAKDETRRQYRTSKHRYIYLVGDRREVRAMRRALRYPVLDTYPKGDTEHYCTENPTPFVGKTLKEYEK